MLRILSFLLLILPFTLAAQKEITLNFGKGSFHFIGSSAIKNSSFIVDGN